MCSRYCKKSTHLAGNCTKRLGRTPISCIFSRAGTPRRRYAIIVGGQSREKATIWHRPRQIPPPAPSPAPALPAHSRAAREPKPSLARSARSPPPGGSPRTAASPSHGSRPIKPSNASLNGRAIAALSCGTTKKRPSWTWPPAITSFWARRPDRASRSSRWACSLWAWRRANAATTRPLSRPWSAKSSSIWYRCSAAITSA